MKDSDIRFGGAALAFAAGVMALGLACLIGGIGAVALVACLGGKWGAL
jgi:CBS-domain-containing membrane protein